MLAYRRTSTLAARALARNCQGSFVVGAKPGAQARADFGASIGRRCLFSALPEHIVVGMPGIHTIGFRSLALMPVVRVPVMS